MPTPLKDPDFAKDLYKVSCWEDVNAALKSPEFIAGRKIKRPTHDNIVVFINGDDHLERRQVESRVFNREALSEYERETLRPLLADHVEAWREAGTAELVHETLMLFIRVGGLLTGIDGIDSDEKAEAILEYVDAFAAAGAVEWARLPDDEKQKLLERANARLAEFPRRYIDPARARREELIADCEAGKIERSDLPRDVITELLLHARDDWKDEMVLGMEVLAYLTGSVRTSARAVCNSVQEIHDWLSAHPEDDHLRSDPVFVRNAVNEALRLHVVAPALLRITTSDVTLPSGLEIPADEYVAILYARANRDPRYFGDDAEDFDPRRSERGLPGRDYGVSFAAGAHNCIGRRLAVGAGGEQDSANNGTVMTLVEKLVELGAVPDPDDPPVPNDASDYDEYIRYPVRFTRL